MPPGALKGRENRFALLANDSPPKKKKTSRGTPFNLFPELPCIDMPNPKYLVLSCMEENKSMADFSCFAVHKAIQLISKEIISINQLRDGNLLLLAKDAKVADKFLSSSNLLGVCRIKCTLHDQLNTTKGTVYAPYLNKVSEAEIVNELKCQGVTSIFKFNKFIEGKPQPSGVILLSFDSYHLPSKIDISWNSVQVKEYIPNPMRCRSCQLLGHTAKWCKNSPACVNCNLPPHSPSDCSRTLCANCSEQHPASSKDCLKFQQQKDILSIKTKNKCSMQEARKIFRSQLPTSINNNKNSYASVASSSVHNPSSSSKITTPTQNNPIIFKNIDSTTTQKNITQIANNNNLQLAKNTSYMSTTNNLTKNKTSLLSLSKSKSVIQEKPISPSKNINADITNTITSSKTSTKQKLYRSNSNASIDLFPDELDCLEASANTSPSPVLSDFNTQFPPSKYNASHIPPISLLHDDECIADEDDMNN